MDNDFALALGSSATLMHDIATCWPLILRSEGSFALPVRQKIADLNQLNAPYALVG
jgi:hypothetical protein